MSRPLAFLLARVAARGLRRRARGWWLLATASAAAPGGCGALQQDPPPATPSVAQVVRVVDGDTIVVRAEARQLTVRLLGIDTPETHGGPAECGGPAASRQRAHRASGQPRATRHRPRLRRHARPLRAAARLRRQPPRRPRRAPAARRPRLRLPLPRQALLAARSLPARGGRRARPPPRYLVRLRGRLPFRPPRPPTLTTTNVGRDQCGGRPDRGASTAALSVRAVHRGAERPRCPSRARCGPRSDRRQLIRNRARRRRGGPD
jgi:hypothetical protein